MIITFCTTCFLVPCYHGDIEHVEIVYIPIKVSIISTLYHIPFTTDIGTRAKDNQQPNILGQLKKVCNITVSSKIINSRIHFMKVPWYVPEDGQENKLCQFKTNKLLFCLCSVFCSVCFIQVGVIMQNRSSCFLGLHKHNNTKHGDTAY